VRRAERCFEIEAAGVTYEADSVIVATGAFHTPRIPAFAKQLDPAIMQLHSNSYRNAKQLRDGAAMVVGAGNSGAQIALELAETRGVFLAGRSVGSMPRRFLGRDLFDWLWPTVMRPGSDSLVGRRLRARIVSSTDKLIGMSEMDLQRGGVRRAGRVAGVRGANRCSRMGASPT
jgi:putative flavoprotein involved in K+ transport